MASQQEVIKKFMASLDTTTKNGAAALNEAIKSCSTFTGMQNAIDQMIADCKNAKSADVFLKTYCGINLDNTDTGAITGLDAGGDTIKTAESIIPEEGSLIEFTSGNWFTTEDGLIVMLGERIAPKNESDNMREKFFKELSKQEEIYIWRAIYTWWMEGGLKLISDSFGDNYSFASTTATTKKLWIVFDYYDDDPDSTELMAAWGGPVHARRSTHDIKIHINMNYYKDIDTTGVDGKSEDASLYFDRCLTHELTHAVMRANINYFDYLPAFVKEGMAELTHGIDDFRTDSIKKLAGNSDLLAKSLVFDEKPVTVSGVNNPTYAGGYMFFRWLARQSSDFTIENTKDLSVKTFYGNDHVKNFVSKASIDTGAGDDYVAVGSDSKKVTVDSGAGHDFINNWGPQANIIAGSGDDTVYNASLASNACISSGAGNDSIDNLASNVTIDAGAGNDTVSSNNNDKINSKVSIFGGSGNDSIFCRSNDSTIDGGAGDDTISNVSYNSSVSGGAGADSIYSYSYNATINGGADNDTISLNAAGGNNIIVYASGDGFDTIIGLTNSDTISLSGSDYYTKEISNGGAKISLVSGSGSMTLTDAGNETINVKGSKLLNVINNTVSAKKITAGKGADSITNNANKVTIVGASDADSVWNYGATVSVNAAGGNDYVDNRGNKVTVLGGKGNDTLRNDTYNGGAKNVKLSGGGGNDDLRNWGDNVTMLGGASKDAIYNYSNGSNGSGKNVSIDGGADNDDLHNWGDNVTMLGGTGNDSLYNNANLGGGKNVSIDGGAGNDSIRNFGTDCTLTGDDGDDTIGNYEKAYLDGELVTDNGGKNVKIFGGTGADSIENSGANVTISGDEGNDTIKNSGANVSIDGGADNDLITNTGAKVTISGSDGADTLSGDTGNDKLLGGDGNDSLNGGAGRDTLSGDTDNDKLFGGAANDSLNGGAGRDTLSGGTGNDKLLGGAANDSLNGDAGNDTLSGGTGNDSLWGGAGNDSLWGGTGADVFVYTVNEGTDTIFDYEAADMLKILNSDGTNGKFKSSKYSGADLTLAIKGGGKIIFDNVSATTNFNINGASYKISGAKLVK